jgi:nucleoside-diphosphate-sugar epimerase
MFVRSPDRIAPALGPLGVDTPEFVTGDVTDAQAVRSALEGCDAVLHAASMFTFDVREAKRMQEQNLAGTRLVLQTAHELGLDPIVHVSSYVALLPGSGTLKPDSPVGRAPVPYAVSKAQTELVARELQRAGAPVVTILPGGIWGPHDPHLGEGTAAARDMLRGRVMITPPGIAHVADVRDVAAVNAAVMERGRGPRAYFATGECRTFEGIFDEVRAATGRRLPAPAVPAKVILPIAKAADRLQHRLPFRLPVQYEGPWTLWNGARVDDGATRGELGVTFRPPSEVITATLRWLYETGAVSARQAGRLAG